MADDARVAPEFDNATARHLLTMIGASVSEYLLISWAEHIDSKIEALRVLHSTLLGMAGAVDKAIADIEAARAH